MEKFSEQPDAYNHEAEQTDFFDVLDKTIPNEDVREITLEFGKKIIIDPKERGRFDISNPSVQMYAEVRFNPDTGDILDVDIERYHGESGEIEPAQRKQFRQTAEQAVRDYPDQLGINIHN